MMIANGSAEKNEELPVFNTDRPRLKLSEMDQAKTADLANMFGLWKEADHCDKDYN